MYENEDSVEEFDEFEENASYSFEDQNADPVTPWQSPFSPTNVKDRESSMITADERSVFSKPKKKVYKSKKMSNKLRRDRSARSPCKGSSVKKIKKKKGKKGTKKKTSYKCQKHLDTEVDIDTKCYLTEPLTPSPTRMKSTQTSPYLRKQINLKDLDLLFNIVSSVVSSKADADLNRMYNEGEESGLLNIQEKCELNKKLQEIFELLKHSNQCQPCPQTCVPTCPPLVPPNPSSNICPPNCPCPPSCMRMYQPTTCAPRGSFTSIIQEFQQAFCNPCCRRCRPARCSRSARCSPSRCVPCCSSRSPERKVSKRTKDNDLQFKTRMWLLETNDKLEKKLSKLKAQEEKACCCCSCPPSQHYSASLWQMLMQSLVKVLVESHLAVKKEDGVCQYRLQNGGLQ